ncbi:MAG: hypothetical protein KKD77_24225 [Gammaproteobacteria bacterium]|nr:hypothetical protein [Gammaproteobacteria bacterium]
MATDVNTLMADVKCYACQPPGLWQLLMLGLLKQTAEAVDPMADTTVAGLLEEAKCYACQPPGMWQLLALALLKQIAEAGGTGGGGTGGVLCGAVDPVAAPTETCAFYYRTDTGAVWYWDGAAWVALIA